MLEYDRPTMAGRKRAQHQARPEKAGTVDGDVDGVAELVHAGKPGSADPEDGEPEIVDVDGEIVTDRDADADAEPAEDMVDVVMPGGDDDGPAEPAGDGEVDGDGDGPVGPVVDRPSGGIARRDPLSLYMQEIRRIPLLTREQEHELAVKYFETGDLGLARRLVTANLRLVVKIAHEYRRAYKNLLDLVQEGNVGLLQAVRKYDPHRGVKLSSYSAWWIRAYILKFILNNWRLVKIGTTQAQRKLFFNLRKERDKLERLGFAPEHKLLAERLDVTEDEVSEMSRRLDSSDLSLDAPVSRDDDGGRTHLDGLPSAAGERPDTLVENSEFRAVVRDKLEHFAQGLAGRDQVLFRERWLSETPSTLQDIGDKFGISRERARQLEKRLLDNLRVYLEAELGTAVDIGSLSPEE